MWNSALALLIQSNHDINFISFNIKTLVLVWYIINYATKSNYSQYYQVMSAVFIKKKQENIVKQQSMKEHTVSINQIQDNNKFTLKAYNWLAHDHEISGPLAASMLLKLSKFYTLCHLKLIEVKLFVLRKCFPSMIFKSLIRSNKKASYYYLRNLNKSPSTSFDDY